MKRFMGVLLAVGLAAGSALAGGVGVFGSYWSPKDGDSVWGGGAKLRAGMGPVYLNVRGTYFEDITEDGAGDIGLETIPVDAGIGLQMDLLDGLEVYAGAGGTYYFLDIDDVEVDDEVGWYGEAGAELRISPRTALFAEILWRDVEGTAEGDEIDNIENRTDIDLAGVCVNVGLIVRLMPD